MDVGEKGKEAQDGDNLELDLVGLCAMCSGMVCNRKNKLPNNKIASTRITLSTTISTSVSPGAVMKDGRWWEEAAG
jgi:hypothetical protein